MYTQSQTISTAPSWVRRAALLLCTLGLLVACGGEPPAATPTPEPPPPATTAPVAEPAATSPLPSPAPTVAPALTAPPTNGGTAVFTPLVVEEGGDCSIESHLDLIGYPELELHMGCAVAEAIFDPIALNEFGDEQPTNRFMLWFSHENLIYVLYPDGSYRTYPDTWEEGVDPVFSCNPLGGEAESPPLPRRGFGKLWCNNPEIQAVMGSIPREERLCQYAVLQRFEEGRLLACFEDATVRYFRLLNGGVWDILVQ